MPDIAIIHTDKRQEMIGSLLRQKGYHVVMINHTADLENILQFDALVLPVRGVDANQSCLLMNGETCCFDEFLKHVNLDMKVFSGIVNAFVDTWPLQVVYLFEDYKVVEDNALLTAQGVLGYLLDNIDIGIRELTVDIIGYGHCGNYITEFLHGLKVPLRIVTRKEMDMQKMGLQRCSCMLLSVYQKQNDVGDVIINTAPAHVITREMMQGWQKKPLIIDIASHPGGVDYEAAKALDIRAIPAPPLPSVYTPKSAARVLASAIEKEMQANV